ncbi:MAG: hypothetical protein RSA99_02850 [Oscillospiraceae bacterium]
MKSKEKLGISVGISSIIMIFVILCLTTFGTLSFLTANSDYKITQKSKEATIAYYKADCLAVEKIGQIDKMLSIARKSAQQFEQTRSFENLDCGIVINTYKNTINDIYSMNLSKENRIKLTYIDIAKMIISLNKNFAVSKNEKNELFVSYTISMDKNHSLNSKIQILDYDKENTYKIIDSVVINNDNWSSENIEVWDGE